MYKRTLRYGQGYTGKMGSKCWIAAITGSSNEYGLSRDFVEAAKVEREHFNRARTMINFAYELNVGLYEQSEGGDREFFAVWIKNGEHVRTRMDEARVKAMVALMDGGMSAEEARIATKPAPQPTQE